MRGQYLASSGIEIMKSLNQSSLRPWIKHPGTDMSQTGLDHGECQRASYPYNNQTIRNRNLYTFFCKIVLYVG